MTHAEYYRINWPMHCVQPTAGQLCSLSNNQSSVALFFFPDASCVLSLQPSFEEGATCFAYDSLALAADAFAALAKTEPSDKQELFNAWQQFEARCYEEHYSGVGGC